MVSSYLNRPKMAMTVIGFWFPPETYSTVYLIFRCIQMGFIYSFFLFNVIYMIMALGDLAKVMEASYLLFTEGALSLKITNFLIKQNSLAYLLEFMDSDIFAAQNEIHRKILADESRRMWRVYSFFITCAICNCTEWAIFPLMESGPRIFPFKIWMPVDPSDNPGFHIGYVYQVYSIFMSATIFLTVVFITVSLIMFASAQLEIVAEKIQTTKPVPISAGLKMNDQKDLLRDNNNILKECICHHQAIIRFVELSENVFNVNIFFQLTGTVAIICIIGLQMTVDKPNTMQFYSTLNYLVTMLAQLYLYCWCGNELTNKSQVLRDALYNSPWYEQDQKFRKTLWIAMECMKRPIIFRAGHYIALSRPNFVSILRCSYSYFAVLNQANSKRDVTL